MITVSGYTLLIADQDFAEGLSPEELEGWTLIGRDEFMTITGQEDSTGFGTTIEMGDIDGDGRDDIFVGVPTFSGNQGSGAVLIYFARDLDDIAPLTAIEDADVIVYGEEAGDRFGQNIALGDMNGDGRDELLVSAPRAFGWQGTRRWSGEVYILSGRDRSEFPSKIWIGKTSLYGHIYGRDALDQIGLRMTMGDLTGDGRDELVLGTNGAGGFGGTPEYHADSENNAPNSWEIEVIEGTSSPVGTVVLERDIKMIRYFSSWNSTLTPPDTHARHIGNGMDVSDFNGDGFNDLLFSWSKMEGPSTIETLVSTQVEIIRGGPGFPYVPINTTIDIVIPTFEPNLTIQMNKTMNEPPKLECGDLDGDPTMDMVIGNPNGLDYLGRMPEAGQVHIMRGFDFINGDTIYTDNYSSTIFGLDSKDRLGSSLLCIDMDDDGFDEVMIGAPYADGERNLVPDCGEGYRFDFDGIFTPELESFDANESYMGYFEGGHSFHAISYGDIDQDGVSDLLVSTPDFSPEDSDDILGLVSLFMIKQDFEMKIYGRSGSRDFGRSIVIEDFNMDGYEDILVGDPNAMRIILDVTPPVITQDGEAYILFGGPTSEGPIFNLESDADITYKVDLAGNQAELGKTVTSGDLNDDGYPDAVIGAPSYYDGANNCGGFYIAWGGNRTYMEEQNRKLVLGQTVEMVGDSIVVGDFNGDLKDDLAVSATATTASQSLGRYHAGNVYIFFGDISSGNTRINSADVVITGSLPNEQIGKSLAAGDIDNDGIDDLVIGAPYSDLGSVRDQGLTYIMKGRNTWGSSYDLSTDASTRIFGPWPYDQTGSTLAAGDLDGDDHDDIVIGASSGDGYQRTAKEAGNVYVMLGSYLSENLDGGNLSLRDQYNMTVFGENSMERLGSSLGIGDLDGDGGNDVAMGAIGWLDPVSGAVPGGVKILPSKMIRDGGELNSSSIPVLTSKRDGDLFGTSIYISDYSGDGTDDMLMGAPKFDPYGTGEIKGGLFLWEGKDIYIRDIKVSPIMVLGTEPVSDPEEIMSQVYYLSPQEGPYKMRVTGRSVYGYDDVSSISIAMDSLQGPGSCTLVFNTTNREFEQFSSGDFTKNIWIEDEYSSGTTDGVESWYVDFSFDVDWDMPDPDVLTTYITGGSSSYRNYLSKEFRIDRTIFIEDEGLKVSGKNETDLPEWLNASTYISVKNISLSHIFNGEPIHGRALENISLGLYRPDGILIGRSHMNGTRLDFDPTTAGEGVNNEEATFTIGPLKDDPLPSGSIWQRNLTFQLKADTTAPPEVTSFNIFPDGKEKGIVPFDDDRFVELNWVNVVDLGPSGIDRYVLEVIGEEETTIYDSVRSGDLIMIPEGEVNFTLHAMDRAGNPGPKIKRTVTTDTGAPFFRKPIPADESWLNDQTEELSIITFDGVSGIDVESAEYRVFYQSADVVGEWKDVLGWEVAGNETRLVAPVPDEEGFGLYIQWKISDLAGLTTVSEPYTFSIDKTPPIIEPDQEELIAGPGEIEFDCFMEDSLSWLNLSTVEFRIASADAFQGSVWRSMDLEGFRISYSPSYTVDPGFEGYGYAQWRVTDRAGNYVESDLISILVDTTLPEFTDFTPNTTTIQSDTEVDVSVTIIEEGSGILPGDVEISVSTISGWVQYGVGGFSPWIPVDLVEEFNNNYVASSTVTLDEGRFNQVRFRVRDGAGNGWVISSSHSIEVDLPEVNLPPRALFNVVPVSDMIFQGESLTLDATPSSDPEGAPLNFTWFSDLEGFPGDGMLGTEPRINVTLSVLGVHSIWMVVTDGVNTVTSEEVNIRVVERQDEEPEEESEEETLLERVQDSIMLLILALLIGIILGAVIIYLAFVRRMEQEPVLEPQPMVDATYEDEYVVPYCPYCGEEARPSDEYCIKCGSVFTEKDKEGMLKGKKKKKKKKKKESLKAAEEEATEEEEDWDIPEYEDGIEVESDFFAETPEELEIEDLDEEELEEIDEEDLEELDEDDWEVEE